MPDDELFICSERSALNMAYQGITKEVKKVSKIFNILGLNLIGLEIEAPFSSLRKKIYVLPNPTIETNKATGVTMSVPSCFSEDFAMLRDL